MNFFRYSHLFMSIGISQMKDHSISIYQAEYATSTVSKYFDTATFKAITKFCKNTLPYDMIFTKNDAVKLDGTPGVLPYLWGSCRLKVPCFVEACAQ